MYTIAYPHQNIYNAQQDSLSNLQTWMSGSGAQMLNVKVNNSIEDRNVQNIFLKRELCQSLVILDGP